MDSSTEGRLALAWSGRPRPAAFDVHFSHHQSMTFLPALDSHGADALGG